MRKNSPVCKINYLLPLILISILISPALSNSLQDKDNTEIQQKDTSGPGNKDTAKVQAKDTTRAPVRDTSKIQVKDTTKTRGKDSTKVQPKDTLNRQVPDSVILKRTDFTAEDLIRGERLFYGLVYLGDKSTNCEACHNTHVSDTLNWNPDALEISKKYHDKTARDLSKVLLKPLGPKMKLVHKGFQLTAEDIVLIKAYMNKFVGIGLKQNKPVITNLLLLIIALLLFLLSLVDIVIKKLYKDKRINWAILTVTGVFITWILAVNAIGFGRAKGYAPAQPIKFSHAVHAGQNKTDCNYCHYTARISKTAGIPSGSICLNCHFLVRNGTRSGATEIAKVLKALDDKKPVEWIRIYKLPDFVFFSHEQHVSAGGITCDACHGNVKEMNRLYQVPDLSMGWCIDCHKTRKVNLSNEYYKTYYSGFYDSLNAGKIDSVRVTGIGGRDCGKCHY
jgi:hypothetical protein